MILLRRLCRLSREPTLIILSAGSSPFRRRPFRSKQYLSRAAHQFYFYSTDTIHNSWWLTLLADWVADKLRNPLTSSRDKDGDKDRVDCSGVEGRGVHDNALTHSNPELSASRIRICIFCSRAGTYYGNSWGLGGHGTPTSPPPQTWPCVTGPTQLRNNFAEEQINV